MRRSILLIASFFTLISFVEATNGRYSWSGESNWFWKNAYSRSGANHNSVEYYSGGYYGNQRRAHSYHWWWGDDSDDGAEDQPPEAVIHASTLTGYPPLKIWFSGKLSEDDWGIESVRWNFGDGTTSTKEALYHTFVEAGDYTVSLTVYDEQGQSDTSTITVTVLELPDDRVVDGLLAYYDFSTGSGELVFDMSQVGKPLDLEISDIDRTDWIECGGLRLNDPTSLVSDGGTQKVVNAVKHSHEITVEF